MEPVAAAIQSPSTCAHVAAVVVVAAAPIVGKAGQIGARDPAGTNLLEGSPMGVVEAEAEAEGEHAATILAEAISRGAVEAEVAAPIADKGAYIAMAGQTCRVSSFGAISYARSRARPSCGPSAEASSSGTSCTPPRALLLLLLRLHSRSTAPGRLAAFACAFSRGGGWLSGTVPSGMRLSCTYLAP